MLVYMIPDVNGFSFCPGFRALLAILGSKIEGRDEKIAAGNRFGTEKNGCWRIFWAFWDAICQGRVFFFAGFYHPHLIGRNSLEFHSYLKNSSEHKSQVEGLAIQVGKWVNDMERKSWHKGLYYD